MLHLFDYWRMRMSPGCSYLDALPPEAQTPELQAALDLLGKLPTLEEQLGMPPDLELFERLYEPAIPFEPLPNDEEAADYDTTRIVVDGVVLRFVQGMSDVNLTVEGALPRPTLEGLAEELRSKLSRLENSDCEIVWIGD
jgi:hypothetical protein